MLASTPAFFGPTVNEQIVVPLLNEPDTFFAPRIVQGQSLVAPLQRLELLLSPEDWESSLAATTRRPKPRTERS